MAKKVEDRPTESKSTVKSFKIEGKSMADKIKGKGVISGVAFCLLDKILTAIL